MRDSTSLFVIKSTVQESRNIRKSDVLTVKIALMTQNVNIKDISGIALFQEKIRDKKKID